MADITVNYEALRQVAGQLQSGREDLQQRLQHLQGLIDSLVHSDFQTRIASGRFDAAYQQWTVSARGAMADLGTFMSYVQRVLQGHQDLDAHLGGAAGEHGGGSSEAGIGAGAAGGATALIGLGAAAKMLGKGPLNEGEIGTLQGYMGAGAHHLNRSLAGRNVPAQQLQDTRELNAVLDKLPDFEGRVFRKINMRPETLAKYQPGSVVVHHPFTSTSSDPYAYTKARTEGKIPVEQIIISKTGKYVDPYAYVPGEKEVLFKSETPFYVDQRYELPDGRILMVMREVSWA